MYSKRLSASKDINSYVRGHESHFLRIQVQDNNKLAAKAQKASLHLTDVGRDNAPTNTNEDFKATCAAILLSR